MTKKMMSFSEKEIYELLMSKGADYLPIPVETLAKKSGLEVRHQPLDGGVSGFLLIDGQLSIIGVNSQQPRVRQRFTVAHELGHFMLNREKKLHVDHQFPVLLKLRSKLSKEAFNDEERQANMFAAAVLMPKKFLDEDLEGVTSIDFLNDAMISSLAKKYQVSTQALILRLNSLGYIGNNNPCEDS